MNCAAGHSYFHGYWRGAEMKLGRRMSGSVKCIVGIMAVVVLRTAIVPVLHAAEMKAEDVVARHLDSIGTAEVRAGAKSRIVQEHPVSEFRLEQAGSSRAQVLWSRRDANRS